MGTIDHATEARENLAVAWDHAGEVDYRRWIDQAQVHATLALSDEQRTANLIAERGYLAGLLAAVPRMSDEAETIAHGVQALHRTIRKRLGLTS